MKKPNILILHTDQQRWDTIKANGNSVIKTPNLDRLATSGTNFSSCYSQNPVCMPSRISFMTGQYCSALKITQMAVTVPQETETIQKILGRNGYYNGLIGKLHYLAHSNRDHRELHPSYDFHHLELSDEPGCYEDAYRAWVRRKAPEELDNIPRSAWLRRRPVRPTPSWSLASGSCVRGLSAWWSTRRARRC
jgi:arylsulfatase